MQEISYPNELKRNIIICCELTIKLSFQWILKLTVNVCKVAIEIKD